MYIVKNAFTSITRNIGRNILVGIIIVVISCAATISLAILSSANSLVKSYWEANPLIASISMNRNNLMSQFRGGEDNQESNIEAFNNISPITLTDISEYGDSEYLKGYYYTYNTSLDSDTLTKATQSVSREVINQTTEVSGNMPDNRGFGRDTTTIITKSMETFQNSKMLSGDFTLMGYSSYEAMEEFVSGQYKINEGTLFTDFTQYDCVINQELATLNSLAVGDSITLKNSNTNKTYTFKVMGIYEEVSDSNDMNDMYSKSANTIIVSSDIVVSILSDDEELSSNITPSFILKDENVIDSFSKEVSEKGLSEYYQVTTNLESIESGIKSINNVKTFATTFLVITLIIGGIVLFVINMINVRERKYEIGVLRTIGMKKSFVILQFVSELLFVSVIGLTIGALIGSVSSVPVANHLLSSEISSSTENINNISNNFGGMHGMNNSSSSMFHGVMNVDKITEINAVVNIKVISELLAIGLLLTLISSLSAMISIERFSPLTILKERS